MATSTNKAHRSLAVLDLPKRINVLITYANSVVEGMTGNASFPTPSPALVTVTAAITDLQIAETAALANKLKLADHCGTDIATACEDADLVIVCTPVGACGEATRIIAPRLKPGCIVSDVGSVKQAVIDAMYAGFADGREFTTCDVSAALKRLVPLSVSQRETVSALRAWLNEGRAQSASVPTRPEGGPAILPIELHRQE